MKDIKNLPIYVLSGALIFVGIASASQAQAAWSSKETSRIKSLEAKVQQLERQLGSQELISLRYLATSGGTGFVKDICLGVENLENLPSYMPSGRLLAPTDLFGREITDIYGKADTPGVYECKIQFYAKKSN